MIDPLETDVIERRANEPHTGVEFNGYATPLTQRIRCDVDDYGDARKYGTDPWWPFAERRVRVAIGNWCGAWTYGLARYEPENPRLTVDTDLPFVRQGMGAYTQSVVFLLAPGRPPEITGAGTEGLVAPVLAEHVGREIGRWLVRERSRRARGRTTARTDRDRRRWLGLRHDGRWTETNPSGGPT